MSTAPKYPASLLKPQLPARAVRIDAESRTVDQVDDARRALQRGPESFRRWPFKALHNLVGAIALGDVWVVGAFTGGGKTTFVTSAVDGWYEAGHVTYAMPLEATAHYFRTYWACHRSGVYPGSVFDGSLAHGEIPNGDAIRATLDDALIEQQEPPMSERVYVSGVAEVSERELVRAFHEAKDCGASLLIVDHVDHIAGEPNASFHAQSVAIVKRALSLSKELSMATLLTSQLNNETTKGNALSKWQPPRDQHFYMGQHKLQVATGVLGLFRPIRGMRPGESEDEYTRLVNAVRNGTAEPSLILDDAAMGVVQVKGRNRGANNGKRVLLRYDHGKVRDFTSEELIAREAHQYATSARGPRP